MDNNYGPLFLEIQEVTGRARARLLYCIDRVEEAQDGSNSDWIWHKPHAEHFDYENCCVTHIDGDGDCYTFDVPSKVFCSDSELEAYCVELVRARLEREEQSKQKKLETQRQKDLAELARLKAKYEGA